VLCSYPGKELAMNVAKPAAAVVTLTLLTYHRAHIEPREFAPEPKPASPYVLMSTATMNTVASSLNWWLPLGIR